MSPAFRSPEDLELEPRHRSRPLSAVVAPGDDALESSFPLLFDLYFRIIFSLAALLPGSLLLIAAPRFFGPLCASRVAFLGNACEEMVVIWWGLWIEICFLIF